ncbi:unnamed protein product [Effrenium voratum]|nr:unnamed protein product [Effrenium voratum]
MWIGGRASAFVRGRTSIALGRQCLSEVPTLNIAPFLEGGSYESRLAVAKQLDAACVDLGCFYLEGHGVPESQVRRLHGVAKEFFTLPASSKEAIAISEGKGRGYQKLGLNVTKQQRDYQEAIDFYAEPAADKVDFRVFSDAAQLEQFAGAKNLWPEEPVDFKETFQNYFGKMSKTGNALMEAMSLALGLPQDHFAACTAQSFWGSRVVGYPSLPPDFPGLSCGEHTDYGCWVILCQDETPNALEVKFPDGIWRFAPPRPGKLLVNLGDMLSVWTRGRYKPTEHRVRHTSAGFRTSVVYFHDPNFDAVIHPLDLEPSTDMPDSSPLPYGEYLFSKVRSNFDFATSDSHARCTDAAAGRSA